jgi:hypothetical protein
MGHSITRDTDEKLAGTDSAARSRICIELTVGLYAKMDGSEVKTYEKQSK